MILSTEPTGFVAQAGVREHLTPRFTQQSFRQRAAVTTKNVMGIVGTARKGVLRVTVKDK
jgi:hypothetical protein